VALEVGEAGWYAGAIFVAGVRKSPGSRKGVGEVLLLAWILDGMPIPTPVNY